MALSTEQFERIVGKVEPSTTAEETHRVMLPDGSYTEERRQGSRFRFGQRAKIRLERADQPAEWTTVMLQDISLEGISFLNDQELPIEARLLLCLKDQVGELTTIRCVVRRCEPGGFGRTSFTIGGKFQQIVPQGSKEAEGAGDDTASASSSSASGSGADDQSSGTMIHRAANILNPARWWSHLTREYDDFSATGTGSKLSKEMQTKIAQTMENYPAAAPHAPHAHSEEMVPSGQSSAHPRRSSIFLHPDDAPPPTMVVPPPVAVEKAAEVMQKPAPVAEQPPAPPATEIAQPAPASEPAPVTVQTEPANEPAPVIAQQPPDPEPAPTIAQPAPASELAPVAIQPKPANEPAPVIAQQPPDPEPAPTIAQPAPASELAPVAVQPKPANEPAPVIAQQPRDPEPAGTIAQPAPASKPAPETLQPTPVSEPAPVTVQPKPANEPTPVITKPAPAREPAPVIAQPTPASKPAPVISQPTPAPETAPVEMQKKDEPQTATILDDYARWAKRDLSVKRYVYMWAGELKVSSPSGDSQVLVLLGAGENGQTELIALQATTAAGPATWKKLLLNVMRRGLIKPPKMAIGDRALGFWPALADFARGTAKQYSWTHQIAHVLALLPKGMQRLANKELQRIIGLSKREEATQAIDLLVQDFGADAPQAAACLQQEKDRMLSFYDFPAEHWPVSRDDSVIQKMFQTNGPIKRDESLLMDEMLAGLLKLAQAAQSSWPKLPESQHLAEVLRGEPFIDGLKQAA